MPPCAEAEVTICPTQMPEPDNKTNTASSPRPTRTQPVQYSHFSGRGLQMYHKSNTHASTSASLILFPTPSSAPLSTQQWPTVSAQIAISVDRAQAWSAK